MKEVTFIRNNIEKWLATEKIAANVGAYSPDDLADAYTDITADLAFAYTNYPQSKITLYLNNLASVLHNTIYRNKKENRRRMITFWTQEVPRSMYEARWLLLASFIIFLLSCLVGVVSQIGDSDFCRGILGNTYVDMTLENIKNGNPVDVYSSGSEVSSFIAITYNNVSVAFVEFAAGLLTAVGTGLVLFYNGVMMGCFMSFFAQHGVFWEAAYAVFLHGTLELSVIVVAGAAGLALGNGILFPDTYSRGQSFKRGARRGLKIVVGTVPIFILAGFVEGFLTRHTEVGSLPRIIFILLSAAFIIYYFVLLPIKIAGKKTNTETMLRKIRKEILCKI